MAVLAFVLALILVVAEAQRRQGLYWYDVTRDYVFHFDTEHVNWATVHVGSDGLELPAGIPPRAAVFLELRLASTWLGRWAEPCLAVKAGQTFERQCFERGARGLRYVLLPRRIDASPAQVELLGDHVDWEPQPARVAWFDAPGLDGRRLLVLAPHPDDAEIAAFGLYSHLDSYVTTITAGNYVDGLYGDLGLGEQEQDDLRGKLRVWDSLTVPQLGGVRSDRTVNLGYLTYSLENMYEQAGSVVPEALSSHYRDGAIDELLGRRKGTASWAGLVADLVALLEAVRPDIVVTPHPALDDHRDHKYTTVALLEALESLGDRSTTLFLYTNHLPLAEHYPFGPSTAVVTLPPWFRETRISSVVSHPLDDRAQLRKLFALEAMHDLRAPPLRLTESEPARVLMARLRQAGDLVRRDPFGDYSYFRRAVRPNELFFVYPPDARPNTEELASWLRGSH